MITVQRARELRAMIEKAAGAGLDNKDGSTAVELFPTLTGGGAPEAAPNLWEDVLYKNGVRVIPSPITAGLAFSKGERGYWGDVLYESLLDSNTWTPEEYPAGWQEVTA